jgi:hypothetical protein
MEMKTDFKPLLKPKLAPKRKQNIVAGIVKIKKDKTLTKSPFRTKLPIKVIIVVIACKPNIEFSKTETISAGYSILRLLNCSG